jgi:CopA family copper-resistance protein
MSSERQDDDRQPLSRRTFLSRTSMAAGAALLGRFVTGCGAAGALAPPRRALRVLDGRTIDLRIAQTQVSVGGESAMATTVNGGIPGPLLRLREGEDVVLRVTNALDEDSSIHWHGLLVPPGMDGVPGVSFPGIAPAATFEYRFGLRQSGTYWYHSHSGLQEQTGIYGPIVVVPREPEPYEYDRELTIVLSDWTFENPHRVMANLKRFGGYYNFQRRTLANFGAEPERPGADRLRWARMRMDASDISDVTGATYTYLMNGLSPDENWRGRFRPGERLRLRFINASAATYFDVRIPGLPMRVIQADGMPVAPVETDEFRLAIAETLDVLVEPADPAYTIFAEAMDRSGHARGTLATNPQATAPVPQRRPRPLLTMADMGMDMAGMDMSHGDMPGMDQGSGGSMPTSDEPGGMSGMEPGAMVRPSDTCRENLDVIARHGDDGHGAGNSMVAQTARSRVDEPGAGLGSDGWRVLTYSQLRRATPAEGSPAVTRTIELHLTGNMERYMWSFDGEQYDPDMPDIVMDHGERVRFVLINDTMMAHPIHLHGMFFELDVGACERNPLKHTVNVQPAERTSFVVTAEEVGRWAFHCHILYHMDAGMFRVVEVRR